MTVLSRLRRRAPATGQPQLPHSLSPRQRAWQRFRHNRLGYWSLVLFVAIFVLSMCAELLSSDRPLVVRYKGEWYFPIVKVYPETTFDGDFPTRTDYLDPFIRERITSHGNFAIFPPNRYSYETLNYFAKEPNPAPPRRTTGWVPTTADVTCWPVCCTASAYRCCSAWRSH